MKEPSRTLDTDMDGNLTNPPHAILNEIISTGLAYSHSRGNRHYLALDSDGTIDTEDTEEILANHRFEEIGEPRIKTRSKWNPASPAYPTYIRTFRNPDGMTIKLHEDRDNGPCMIRVELPE